MSTDPGGDVSGGDVSGGDVSGRSSVTLHSSWSGIVLAYLGALVFVGFAVLVLVSSGWNLVTGFLLVLALVGAIVVLVDLPIASEFHPDRVVRRAVLRHSEVKWEDVTRLTRARVGVLRTRHGHRSGGLVAVRNGRNHLLVDRAENEREYDAMRSVMGEWADVLIDDVAVRPALDRDPTWMYRRRRWRPGPGHDG